MSEFEFDQSESTENAAPYLKKPGRYHVVVTELDGNPSSRDGKPMDALKVGFEVLDGTEKSEIKKAGEMLLWKGKPTDKDGGEMANKKLTRLAVAFGGQHSPGGKGKIDLVGSLGRQIVVDMQPRKSGDKEYLDVNYANIYHVDDPAVADVPKSEASLALIPAAWRKQSVASVVSSIAPSTPLVANTASAAGVSLDDI